MAEWRIGRGWSDRELKARLQALGGLQRNFSDPVEQMTLDRGWHHYSSEAVIAQGPPGVPEEKGLFERGRMAVANYEFSDPGIVIAHFDPEVPLPKRYILLEMRALRVLHYLGGVVVGAVRSEREQDQTVFGFRYDTLEGHIEQGVEWFLLTKDHATGAIRFRIEAAWRPGQFPNWWSRLGFVLVGQYYQERWHRRAHRLMAQLVHRPPASALERGAEALVHTNPDVVFTRDRARNA
jgi:uncharacterized protein (UPF0548 family)